MTDNANALLLTIAIPTYKRASFLGLSLEQLTREMKNFPTRIEVLVSDNASPDNTGEVVANAIDQGLDVRYIRNAENIGSDANIAQCFNLAQGKFVLIMGDDDLFVDGALQILLTSLDAERCGVVCMRPFGFESDFRKENPGSGGQMRTYSDAGDFLAAIGALMTLISACVINKRLLPDIDARQFCGDNLVQVHLVLRAALAAKENIFIDRYLIACKRNNSGGYDFSQVFVSNLGAVLDSCKPKGLSDSAIFSIEKNLMLAYYPFYLLRLRLTRSGDSKATLRRFKTRFHGRLLFTFWLAPIMWLPRPLAAVWGGITTLVGRVLNGDLRRGLAFVSNRIVSRGTKG
jgi:abequosyltransferase